MNKHVDKLEYDNSISKRAYNMTIEGKQRNALFHFYYYGNLIHIYQKGTSVSVSEMFKISAKMKPIKYNYKQ